MIMIKMMMVMIKMIIIMIKMMQMIKMIIKILKRMTECVKMTVLASSDMLEGIQFEVVKTLWRPHEPVSRLGWRLSI